MIQTKKVYYIHTIIFQSKLSLHDLVQLTFFS